MWPGPHADRRNDQLLRDPSGDLRRHHLEHDRKSPGVFHRVGVGEQRLRRVAATLDDVAPELMLALGSETDMRHDGYARRHDAADLLGAPHAALELHRMGLGLFHEPECSVQRLVGSGLVGTEGHICHDESPGHGCRDGSRQRDEVIDGHWKGGVVAIDVVAGGVPYQQEIDASLVENGGGELVVAGEAGDFYPGFLSLLEVSGSDALRRFVGHAASVPACRIATGPRKTTDLTLTTDSAVSSGEAADYRFGR